MKLSQSTKDKNPISLVNYPQSKNINLPKLDRIILKNAAKELPGVLDRHPALKQPSSLKPHHVDISSMLKIEGKNGHQQSTNPRYDL